MSPLSSKELARLVGIGHRTLERWISEGKVEPKTVVIGKKTYRLWTEREIEKVRRVKEKTYRKGRGRKRKAKDK
ncbi:helix-turn-helix domain-containing protein [Acidobacteriia bacterium AH_259_A11_L15]|nr:helix-turn-helix domain-containing protein [Acidobacteriia bacterium AH_259_A11_L15]